MADNLDNSENFPFRFEVKNEGPLSAEEISSKLTELLNAAHHERQEEMEKLAESPDERIRVTLLSVKKDRLRGGILSRMYVQAKQEAEEEGVLWNPVLDALAGAGWPGSKGILMPGVKRDRERQPRVPAIEKELEPMAEWIAKQTDADMIDRMMDTRSWDLVEKVAERAQVMNPELLDEMVEHSRLRAKIVENDTLVRKNVPSILKKLVDLSEKARDSIRSDSIFKGIRDILTKYPGQADEDFYYLLKEKAEAGRDAAYKYQQLLLNVPETPKEILIEYLTRANYVSSEVAIMLHPSFPYDEFLKRVEEKTPEKRGELIQALVSSNHEFSEEIFEELYKMGKDEEVVVQAFIKSRHTPSSILVKIVEDTSSYKVKLEIAQRERTGRAPEVTEALVQSNSKAVLNELVRDPELHGESFRTAVEKLIKLDKTGAAEALQIRLRGNQPVALDPAILTPLLKSKNSSWRRAALFALGQQSDDNQADRERKKDRPRSR